VKHAQQEREALQARIEKMQADMTLVFRQKVQEREEKLKRSEEELYARHREMRTILDAQLRDLEERKRQLDTEATVSSFRGPRRARTDITSRARKSAKGDSSVAKLAQFVYLSKVRARIPPLVG
jgi:hypothetical protein